ncbi:ComF family protein [Rheinheimera baltica]|uniref:ComF family protein n=1 Tax=Rheinheimera baltica TaxID=67576 RepID=UPI00273FA78C|nr:ComF family protein [Rheinheimera baltica]MDP5188639.1 ComF family protein [Rheinheimera baltica]
MLKHLLKALHKVWHQLLPTPCLWCSLPVHRFDCQLCDVCEEALPKLPYALCHYNLLWLPHVARGLHKPAFDTLLSVSYYKLPYQHWLQRWKFSHDLAAGDLLTQQLAAIVNQYQQQGGKLPDAILYVPMHRAKQRSRGFNPAEILAQQVAKQLKLPLLTVLYRPHQQQAQVGLSRKQRQRNLRKAFALSSQQPLPANVALVDDVVTTGATANTLCQLLRRHGVKHISLWTVAVTLFD